VEAAEQALARAQGELAEAEASLREAEERRGDLAHDPAGYRRNEERIAALAAEIDRLRLLVARREKELEQARRREAEARFAEAKEKLERAYSRRRKASRAVADLLAELERAVAKLEKARQAAEEAEVLAKLRLPEHLHDPGWPEGDEPAWPDVKHALEVIAAGPIREAERERAARAALERQRQATLQSMARAAAQDAIAYGSFHRVEALDAEGRRLAAEIGKALAEEEIDRRRRKAREPDVILLDGGRRNTLIEQRLRERVERLKALAKAAQEAAVEAGEAAAEPEPEREPEPAAV
jgi:hypothetical protein